MQLRSVDRGRKGIRLKKHPSHNADSIMSVCKPAAYIYAISVYRVPRSKMVNIFDMFHFGVGVPT
jgi:hypothetical protein